MSEGINYDGLRKQNVQSLQSMQEQEQKKQEQEAQQQSAVNSILNQVLDQQARARLNTIIVAKPEKGKQVESIILQMATTGQIRGKLNENDLIGLVQRVNAQTQKTTKVKFDRRRAALDSDEEW